VPVHFLLARREDDGPNTLIPGGSPLFLIYGGDINDRGEIAGQAFDQRTGQTPAFLATPSNGEAARRERHTCGARRNYPKPDDHPARKCSQVAAPQELARARRIDGSQKSPRIPIGHGISNK
jgi:hypothetical protein